MVILHGRYTEERSIKSTRCNVSITRPISCVTIIVSKFFSTPYLSYPPPSRLFIKIATIQIKIELKHSGKYESTAYRRIAIETRLLSLLAIRLPETVLLPRLTSLERRNFRTNSTRSR